MEKRYEFEAVIHPASDHGGAYVCFPYDIRKEFGKGRLKVEITFDGELYSGSIVNMGVKREDGSICYLIGLRQDIRVKIGKRPGDTVKVTAKVAQPFHKEETTMWECPKCGRKFKNTDQDHYCGAAPRTIEEYIARQPEEVRPHLSRINETIKKALPDAVEKISWSMPTYWKKRNLIHFAASKKHLGLYPGPAAVEFFAERLKEYKTSKGTIQFPYEKPLPLELIAEIAAWCGKEYGA